MRQSRLCAKPLAAFLAGFCLLGVWITQSIAQQAPASTPGVIQINVNLVQVDAVVTDEKGKPVTNLKSDDFELLQDGQSEKIETFEFVNVREPSAVRAAREFSVQSSAATAATLPSVTLSPDQVRRTIAVLVDDRGLSYDGIVHVRESLRNWVDHDMQAGDLVSIVRTNAAMGALQQFTNDKRMLHAAIEQLKYQPGRVGVESFAPFQPGADEGEVTIDTSAFTAELANAELTVSLNALQYVMQGLRDVPGRKSLILFSESMHLGDLDPQRVPLEDRLRRLTDQANRSSVVIYSIDPRGTVNTGLTAADNMSRVADAQTADRIGGRAHELITSQDGLVLLSQRTGGVFYSNSNDVSGGLRQAIDDGDGYYLLGYQPQGQTFNERGSIPKFHSISLRVKRPGLKVRSRTGFYGVPDSPVAPAAETREAQLARALVSPFTTGDLRVRLTTLFSYSDTAGPYIKALFHFDANDLTFVDQPDGTRTVEVDIAAAMFDANGDPAESLNKTWKLQVLKNSYQDTLRRGLVYSVPIPVKKPGPYQMRIALRDAASRRLGSAMQFVEVPDVKSGRLVVSGIVINAQQAQGEVSNPEEPIRADIEGTPAIRIFKPGAAIAYAFEVLNARPDNNKKTQLEMQVRLFQDGRQIYTGPPSPLSAERESANRLAVGGRLQLTKVPAGNYVMQIVVADRLNKDRNRIASQVTDFEIRE